MKKILSLTIIIFVHTQCFAYPKPHAFPPFQIMDNLYYVGTDDVASYLIVTSKGNILINSNFDDDVPKIKASIEKLGFKFSDTKILLVSHVHNDHAAGSQSIKRQTHAKYMVMDADVAQAESGGRSDFHYINDPDVYFPPTKVDKTLHDGDQIKLGGTTVMAHLTAGHTPGCTTWTIKLNDHGKQYLAVIVGSLNVNDGYKLINNKTYPTIRQDYENAINMLKSIPCDIFLGAHAGYFNLKKKYALLNKSNANPFIDPEGYNKHIAQKEQDFLKELDRQEHHTSKN